jgi:hypothetical protein
MKLWPTTLLVLGFASYCLSVVPSPSIAVADEVDSQGVAIKLQALERRVAQLEAIIQSRQDTHGQPSISPNTATQQSHDASVLGTWTSEGEPYSVRLVFNPDHTFELTAGPANGIGEWKLDTDSRVLLGAHPETKTENTETVIAKRIDANRIEYCGRLLQLRRTAPAKQ